MGYFFLEYISAVMVARGWRLPQSMRISLIVRASFQFKNLVIHGIISLLESSPKLEKLEIMGLGLIDPRVSPLRGLMDDQRNHGLLMDDLSCDLFHLKTIKMERVAGDSMLMLARILLKRATTLEKMLIHTHINKKDELDVIVQKLMAYPRSSEKAQVLVS